MRHEPNGLHAALERELPSDDEARALAAETDLKSLLDVASGLRDEAHGNVISYSRKVFIPLTQLCRDVCHYCTFAHPPRPGQPAYLTADEVLDIARAGAAAGCKEALFTLGDKPELRYKVGEARTRRARPRNDHLVPRPRCATSCFARPGSFRTPIPAS